MLNLSQLIGFILYLEPEELLSPELPSDFDFFEENDIVAMHSPEFGDYYGTIISTNAEKQIAVVEYLHPTTGDYFHRRCAPGDMQLVLKANAA